MKKNPNEKFVKELAELKAKLPKRYMGMIQALFPGKFTNIKVYSVIHYGVENYEVLKALRAVIKKVDQKEKALA